MLEKKEISEWVPNDEQLVDCLTKKGASSKKSLQALQSLQRIQLKTNQFCYFQCI